MLKLLVVYAHLLGTSLALGMIALTDARLVAKVIGYKVVIPAPSRFETRAIAIALLIQLTSGAVLISLGLAEDPAFLANPKLQAKLLLVALLCANALVLHYGVFPSLERNVPVARWSNRQRTGVALAVAVSNGSWLYCAFLGIARPWNHGVSMPLVLGIAAVVWLVMFAVVRFVLTLAGRDEAASAADADWIDSLKSTLSGLPDLGTYTPRYGTARATDTFRSIPPGREGDGSRMRRPSGLPAGSSRAPEEVLPGLARSLKRADSPARMQTARAVAAGAAPAGPSRLR